MLFWMGHLYRACATLAAIQAVHALTCSLDPFGEILGCTSADDSPYPLGPFVAIANGADHFCAVPHRVPRPVECWPSEHITARERPTWIRDAIVVGGGARHACAIWGLRRTLTCWGSLRDRNGTETLGAARNISRGVRMLAKADTDARTVCFLRESNNDISCFGENSNEQLGLGVDGADADFVGPAAIRGDAINVLL